MFQNLDLLLSTSNSPPTVVQATANKTIPPQGEKSPERNQSKNSAIASELGRLGASMFKILMPHYTSENINEYVQAFKNAITVERPNQTIITMPRNAQKPIEIADNQSNKNKKSVVIVAPTSPVQNNSRNIKRTSVVLPNVNNGEFTIELSLGQNTNMPMPEYYSRASLPKNPTNLEKIKFHAELSAHDGAYKPIDNDLTKKYPLEEDRKMFYKFYQSYISRYCRNVLIPYGFLVDNQFLSKEALDDFKQNYDANTAVDFRQTLIVEFQRGLHNGHSIKSYRRSHDIDIDGVSKRLVSKKHPQDNAAKILYLSGYWHAYQVNLNQSSKAAQNNPNTAIVGNTQPVSNAQGPLQNSLDLDNDDDDQKNPIETLHENLNNISPMSNLRGMNIQDLLNEQSPNWSGLFQISPGILNLFSNRQSGDSPIINNAQQNNMNNNSPTGRGSVKKGL